MLSQSVRVCGWYAEHQCAAEAVNMEEVASRLPGNQ